MSAEAYNGIPSLDQVQIQVSGTHGEPELYCRIKYIHVTSTNSIESYKVSIVSEFRISIMCL